MPLVRNQWNASTPRGRDIGRHEGVAVGPRVVLIEPEHARIEGHGTDVDEKVKTRGVAGRLGEARHLRSCLGEHRHSECLGRVIGAGCLDDMRIVEEEINGLQGDRRVELRQLKCGGGNPPIGLEDVEVIVARSRDPDIHEPDGAAPAKVIGTIGPKPSP